MKRKLRKEIEIALSIITILIFMFIAMIQDFSLKVIPLIALLIVIGLFNARILKKYGRGIIYGK